MNYEEILLNRFTEQVARLELLKKVKLNFNCVRINCAGMYVSNVPSLKKKGYQTIPLYQHLEPIKGPVVYYYKFINASCDDIRSNFLAYKALRLRNCSAVLTNIPTNTNTLYVGSEKNSIARRTMEHMGYSHPGTGGLQISKWAPELSLELELYYSIVQEVAVLGEVESAMAGLLKPLIGKHNP